jgi:hypothetical protein
MPAVTLDASVSSGNNTILVPNPLRPIVLPVIVDAESVPAIDTPVVITTNLTDVNLPPFDLNHARILYDSKLIGSSVTTTVGANGNYTLIPNTAQRWTFTGTASNLITYLMPSNNSIDTVCINAHNLASAGATIEILYSLTDAGSFVSFAPTQTPAKNNSLMFHVATAVNARRIQINITNASDGVFVGSVYAGIALQMQRPFFSGHTPAVLARQADYYSSMSESGNFIGVEVRRRALESEASWNNLNDEWYRAYFVPFLDSAEVLPFIFAWNLLQYPTDVAYCKNVTNIAPSYIGKKDLMSVSIPLVGIA